MRLRDNPPDPVKGQKTTRPTRTGPEETNCNAKVLSALKAARLELAREKGQPAFVIFTDKSLMDMAVSLPSTLEQMSEIHGVGDKKLSLYGKSFLDIIEQAQN